MTVFKSHVNNTCQEIKHLPNFSQLPCKISHFIENLGQRQGKCTTWKEEYILTFPKTHDEIILFILLCLGKISKTETFNVFLVPRILNLCSIYKLHVKLNYKVFLKSPIIITAN